MCHGVTRVLASDVRVSRKQESNQNTGCEGEHCGDKRAERRSRWVSIRSVVEESEREEM